MSSANAFYTTFASVNISGRFRVKIGVGYVIFQQEQSINLLAALARYLKSERP